MTYHTRSITGQVSYRAGLSAEATVARHYENLGYQMQETRWRGEAGEIDLIMRDGDRLVFVEVKKSRSFAYAAQNLSARQIARIYATAEEYLGLMPAGQLTEARFDLGMVDGLGQIEVLENAFGL